MATAATREIPKAQWRAFFDEFSEEHRGWKATVEVMGKDVGDQEVARSAPFLGISYETKGTGAGNIDIGTGDRPDTLMTHTVDRPRAVRAADTDGGAEADLEIEDEDGRMFLLRVRNE